MRLSENAGGTRVTMSTEIDLTGRVAQMGRGLVEQVAQDMLEQFASCLATQASTHKQDAPAPPSAKANAINPLTLLLRAVVERVRSRFTRSAL
jgi:hypothetical protein